MREEWRAIPGYEGLYEISNLGRVKILPRIRYDKNGVAYRVKEKIATQVIDAYGYPVVSMSKDGVHRAKTVHRLLAKAFIPNPENKRCIDHINGIRTDNRIENLRWATHHENAVNKFRLNNQVDWEDRNISDESRHNFTHSQARAVIRSDGERYESIAEASRALGLKTSGMVSQCVRGLRDSVRGFSFRYEDGELEKEARMRLSEKTKESRGR